MSYLACRRLILAWAVSAVLVVPHVLATMPSGEPDVDFLGKLVAVRSSSADIPGVNAASRLMRDYLEGRGVRCVLETMPGGREALYASTDGSKTPDVMLSVHVDTVPAEDALFTMRREGDKVFGRGVHDCKGAAVVAAEVLVALNGKASVGVLFGSDEEIGGKGTRWKVERGYRPRGIAVVVDSTWNQISYAQKGLAYYKVTASGQGGHSSTPWASDDSIGRLAAAYVKLREAWDRAHPLSEDRWCDVLSCTKFIADGQALNRIPDQAYFVVNLRSVHPDSTERTLQFIRETTGLPTELIGNSSVPCSSDPEHPLAKRLQEAFRKHYPDEAFPMGRLNAATDARCFFDCGVPVMVTGVEGGDSHGSAEWESVEAMKRVRDALIDYCTAVSHTVKIF